MICYKRPFLIILCLVLIMSPLTVFAEDKTWDPIVIDGYFDDWQNKPSSLEMNDNNQNVPDDTLHKNTIALFRDSENVYLYVKVAELYGDGIPGDGKGYQFWCDGRKVTFTISPAEDIYPEEAMPAQVDPNALPEQIPEDVQQQEQTPSDTPQPEQAPTDTTQPEQTPEDIQQPGQAPTDTTQPEQTPSDTPQPEQTPTDIQQPEQSPQETSGEPRILAGPDVETLVVEDPAGNPSPDNSDVQGAEKNNSNPLGLNELPAGSYPLKVEYASGHREADGAEAYLTRSEDRTGDEIEIKIPYTAFSDSDKKIDPEHINTIEFINPNLTHRRIECTGTNTAPYLGVSIAAITAAGGFFIWKRKERLSQ